jgi:dienelactone hydrolase
LGLEPRQVRLRAIVNGQVMATCDVKIVGFRTDVDFTTADTPQLVGVFAAPVGARRAAVVVLLHGSEAGEFASAKAEAGLWTSHGYAAFALIYFSWPYERVAIAPLGFANLPVERLDAVRTWLRSRKEADGAQLGIIGGSKGAELGLLAASRYPWIRAVAACVP